MQRCSLKKRIAFFVAGVCIAGLLPFSHASAQSADISALINLLQKQIASLQEKIAELENISGTQNSIQSILDGIQPFHSYLERGVSSGEVEDLQEFLATLPDIYPEKIISGYFGSLTESAVKRFQAEYGIEQLGIVGPKTRAKLNELLQTEKATNTLPTPNSGAGAPRTDIPSGTTNIIEPSAQTPQTTASGNPLPVSSSSFALEQRPPYSDTTLAQKIHDRVNAERITAGLFPLTWDWELAQVAFLHSSDQARDNEELTNPDILCNYPLIRHEGFLFGYSLKERFESRNIIFRAGGENIGILSASKDLVYQFPEDDPPAECPDIPTFPVGEGTQEERTALYQSIMEQSLAAVRAADRDITWVNRSWFTDNEIAERIVEGWMDSQGHRENILTPYFDTDGMGVVAVNDYFVITHNFVDR